MFNGLMNELNQNLNNGSGNRQGGSLQDWGRRMGNWGQAMGNMGQNIANSFGSGFFQNGGTQTNINFNTYNPHQRQDYGYEYANNGEEDRSDDGYYEHPNEEYYEHPDDEYEEENEAPEYEPANTSSEMEEEEEEDNSYYGLLLKEAKTTFSKKDYTGAIKLFQRCNEITKTTENDLYIAACYLRRGKLKVAHKLLEKLLSADPNNPYIYNYVGLFHIECAKREFKVNHLNSAIENFYTAYEIGGDTEFKNNYFRAKKHKYLRFEQIKQQKRKGLVALAGKYKVEELGSFLKPTYFDKKSSSKDYLNCTITLVS